MTYCDLNIDLCEKKCLTHFQMYSLRAIEVFSRAFLFLLVFDLGDVVILTPILSRLVATVMACGSDFLWLFSILFLMTLRLCRASFVEIHALFPEILGFVFVTLLCNTLYLNLNPRPGMGSSITRTGRGGGRICPLPTQLL